jgi:hypothetical protein
VVTAISPNVVDSIRPAASLTATGSNFTGATFAFLPALVPPAITVGTPQIDPTGTSAILPIAVQPLARGRFTLVGTNAFGAGDTTSSPGNALRLINALDEVDTDGDGYPDGLELLYGSDPADPASVPNLSARGDVTSSAVSVLNLALPFTVEKSATTWFSVRNSTLPDTIQRSATQWFSVKNLTLPDTIQRSATQWFSVLNTTVPFTVSRTAVQWFSVRNTATTPTQWTVVSPPVSVENTLQSPVPTTTTADAPLPLAPEGASRESRGPRVTLLGVSNRQRLVEGQTVMLRAQITGSAGEGDVIFRVNGFSLAIDRVPPFDFPFTVPVGATSLTFGATYRGTGEPLRAIPVSIPVERDTGAAVYGRVVDASGTPVANARVELKSAGLTVEYFEPSAPLNAIPDLTRATPVRTTRVSAINVRGPADLVGPDPFGTGLAPNYAARFSGFVAIPTAGSYTFRLGAKEGGRLGIDGRLVVDMPTPIGGAFQEASGTVDLPAGLVSIEVVHYERAGSGEIQLSVEEPGGAQRVLVPSDFVPRAEPFVAMTDGEGRFVLTGVPAALERVSLMVTRPSGAAVDVGGPATGPIGNGTIDVGVVTMPGVGRR